MTTNTSYEVFIARMGHLPDGSQLLTSATDEPLTDHFWCVWVMATNGDVIDEVADHDFPLNAFDRASAMADRLAVTYGCCVTGL